MKKIFILLAVFAGCTTCVLGQQFRFPKRAISDTAVLTKEMPGFARLVIRNYTEKNDRKSYFSNLFMLQMIAGNFEAALASIDSVRSINKSLKLKFAELAFIQYEIYCKAKLRSASGNTPFSEEFKNYFNEVHSRLKDKDAFYISTAFTSRNGTDDLYQELMGSLSKLRNDSLSLDGALSVCRNYNLFRVFSVIEPLATPLRAEDRNRRYIIQDSILIKTRDGAYVYALVARKKGVSIPQPAILQFSIYASPYPYGTNRLLDPAANGYVSVVAFTRGKGYSQDSIVPYEHDGNDVYDVIDWMTKQSWSNGKVGMYGGSYNGFTQWASAKHLHPALKTIVPSASAAPGLDVPMTNNVFMNFVFPWIYYVSDNRYLDIPFYNDRAVWDSVNTKWYSSGKPYRSLDSILGRPNKIFQRWLNHPSYDSYWQNMIPYEHDFAKINIPVLTTTGYYDGGQIGAMYYFREHLKYNKNANHYLLIGPYGHYGSQSVPDPVYNGYKIDPVANISIHDLIFDWFDHVLKDSTLPSILKDKINFEVMGGNEWKHVPSLGAMSNDTLLFYLSDKGKGTNYDLSVQKPKETGFISRKVDFADRLTINNYSYEDRIIYDSLDLNHGICFVSKPVSKEMSITGAFSGQLNATINKKDLDFSLTLFELMPDGKYFYLSYFMGRASYAKDKSNRQLLKPGQPQNIPFRNSYIACKKIRKGSRIVIVLNINKSPNEQINYGSGKDVSDESIGDAVKPLEIKWFNDSFVRIPVWK